ncbi:MAG: plasmid stabilization protein [Candidatus Delongbacteria bacterium]|nr:plasmid stabilization protein [Candidatus Delongbacteria bacterium]
MVKIIYTKPYIRKAVKFLKKHPDLKGQYEKTFKLLKINPYHPSLRLHKLTGNISKFYSVSINITYRITIEFLIKDDKIIPISIGTHKEVY